MLASLYSMSPIFLSFSAMRDFMLLRVFCLIRKASSRFRIYCCRLPPFFSGMVSMASCRVIFCAFRSSTYMFIILRFLSYQICVLLNFYLSSMILPDCFYLSFSIYLYFYVLISSICRIMLSSKESSGTLFSQNYFTDVIFSFTLERIAISQFGRLLFSAVDYEDSLFGDLLFAICDTLISEINLFNL